MPELSHVLATLERIREDGATVGLRLAELSTEVHLQRSAVNKLERRNEALEERLRDLETAGAGSSATVVGLARAAWLVGGAGIAWLVQQAMG